MQSHYSKYKYQSFEAPEANWHVSSSLPDADNSGANSANRFHGQFADCMEMYTSAQKVAEYLDAHQEWFCRCAQPMKVEPLGENAYALVIGRFGAFGYEVEPKVGLELLPADQGIYRIKTSAVPDYVAPGYDVDFKAVMQLVEAPAGSLLQSCPAIEQVSSEITRVEWQLDLAVCVQFPKFIQRLPKHLIQKTGDRLLNQIVRQVSRRLTSKVQEDFHHALGLSVPLKSRERREKYEG